VTTPVSAAAPAASSIKASAGQVRENVMEMKGRRNEHTRAAHDRRDDRSILECPSDGRQREVPEGAEVRLNGVMARLG